MAYVWYSKAAKCFAFAYLYTLTLTLTLEKCVSVYLKVFHVHVFVAECRIVKFYVHICVTQRALECTKCVKIRGDALNNNLKIVNVS